VIDFPAAWALISANPAAAAGLADRGVISPGKRADIVLVDTAAPKVVATITAGQLAYMTSDGAARLRIG
jgi:alpha-D-ribose 1-methylphosphonate 5-triphosphate diphosphatase